MPPFFLSPTFENGEAGEGFWRSCVNSRVAMMAFSVDDLYCIFPYIVCVYEQN